jgi:hypothetical protein
MYGLFKYAASSNDRIINVCWTGKDKEESGRALI